MLYTRCGLEVGVAASKTFTAQVALLSLLALEARARSGATLPQDEIEFILDEVCTSCPRRSQAFLDGDHPIDEIAAALPRARRSSSSSAATSGLPVALEGALKLKEISYIPTDAYSAGEMKHGPIALLDEGTPVVVVATDIHVYDKIISNIQEIAGARRARDRDRDRRQRGHPAPRRRRHLRARSTPAVPAGGRSRSCRSSSSPTASRGCAASTSTSRATSRRPSRSSSRGRSASDVRRRAPSTRGSSSSSKGCRRSSRCRPR